MTELALKATKQRLTETHKRESGSKNEGVATYKAYNAVSDLSIALLSE
jgi:hypothetical protein